MTHQTFRTAIFRVACFFIATFITVTAHAQPKFAEGGQYVALRETQPVRSGDKIEVVELFWYKCPHCFRLEPYLHRWLETKPDNAEFYPVPAVLSDRWAFDAKMFYTLQALNLDGELHQTVYNSIHRAGRRLQTKQQFVAWAEENGADAEEVSAAFDSFSVNSKVNFAKLMSRKYGITGVPSIIVDGKYRTSVSLAGGHEKLLEVIDFLIDLAAKQRAG